MSGIIFERGEFLEVVIPDDWKPNNAAKSRCRVLQQQNISFVVILDNIGNGLYTAVPCGTVANSNTIPIHVAGTVYYARIRIRHVDEAILHRLDDPCYLEKEDCFKEILSKLSERAERRKQIRIRRAEKRKQAKKCQKEQRSIELKTLESHADNSANTDAEENRKKEAKIKSPINNVSASKSYPTYKGQQKRYISGYEVVSLVGLNRAKFCKKVILSNYPCDDCLKCSNHLMEYVNFCPTSENEGLRVPGKYCTKCDAFYDKRRETLGSIFEESFLTEHYTVNSDYLIPQYNQRIQISRSVQSSTIAAHLHCKNTKENKLITIVLERSEQNREKDIYHYSDPFARQLLSEIISHHVTVTFAGNVFSILKVFHINQDNDKLLNQLKIDKIVLRSGGGLYGGIWQPGIELVDVLLYSPFSNCLQIAHASYDTENEVYYMDIKVFRNFVARYGNPGLKIAAYQRGTRDFSTMQEESVLHAYGYVVGNNGLPSRSRHLLLAEVIDLGIMSPRSILNLLDHNIAMHPSVRYENARTDWEEDKQFVFHYKVNPSRFVIATIGI